MGSLSKCEYFINANVEDTTISDKNLISFFFPDDYNPEGTESTRYGLSKNQWNFIKAIRRVMLYLRNSVSDNVITATKEEDRSDILVFLTLISILCGDTRSQLSRWYQNIDLSEASLGALKHLAKYFGETIEGEISAEALRAILVAYYRSFKYRGTKSFYLFLVACSNVLVKSTSAVSTIINGTDAMITESSTSSEGLDLVYITSPYLVSSVWYSDYSINLFGDMINILRPLGPYTQVVMEDADDSQMIFDAGSYWRHFYSSLYYPYTEIYATSLVSVLNESNKFGNDSLYDSDYLYLPMAIEGYYEVEMTYVPYLSYSKVSDILMTDTDEYEAMVTSLSEESFPGDGGVDISGQKSQWLGSADSLSSLSFRKVMSGLVFGLVVAITEYL